MKAKSINKRSLLRRPVAMYCLVAAIVAPTVFVVLTLAGCLEDISTGYNDLTKEWFAEDTPLAATIAEIDAVSRLHSDSGKYEGFKAIAGREPLRTEAQVHLVKPIFKSLYSESDKADVLVTLINNSSFSCACKLAILRRLDNLSSEDGKMTILKAINERGPCAGDGKEIEIEEENEEEIPRCAAIYSTHS